ncbi:hypothetical protein ACVIGB_003353 [Bradyrhizobium sp. USDA 4341]
MLAPASAWRGSFISVSLDTWDECCGLISQFSCSLCGPRFKQIGVDEPGVE